MNDNEFLNSSDEYYKQLYLKKLEEEKYAKINKGKRNSRDKRKALEEKSAIEKEYNDLFLSDEYKKYDELHTDMKNYQKTKQQGVIINDGENIVKQVLENPQDRTLASNVDDLLKNQYKQSSNPKEIIKADLINSYNKGGYSVSEIDKLHTEALEINKSIDEEALVKSYLEWDDGFKGIAESPINNATNVEDVKIEFNKWADNTNLKSTTDEVQEAVNKAINSSTSKDEAISFIEQNFSGDTKYSSKRIINDTYEYAYEPIHANKRKAVNEASEKAAEQAAKKNLKKSAMRNLGHVTNGVFAVMDYKDAREAGNGVVKSVAKAGVEFAKGELLGGWYMAAMAAKAVPTLAINTIEGVNTMSRSMNSMQRRQVFGDAQFMDTQQLATMRQSGMELAKMSQYNLQQAMMGNEAEYMHRL